ncbi:MAG: NUDIX domain-containing protein [Patescibacteria group bacterium]
MTSNHAKKKRHQLIPASYLTLVKDGKVLLLRRFNTGYEDGKYSMVAGHVNEGETFTSCIVREAMEEAGIILKPGDLEVAHVMQRDSRDSENNHRVDVFFIARQWQGEPQIKEPDKCDDLSWFDLDSLPDNIIPYIRQALEGIKNKTFYSEHGWQ